MHTPPARRRLALVAAAAVVGALLLAGCTGKSSPTTSDAAGGDPVTGGNITVQIPQDPGSLDSVASGNVSTAVIGRHVFESLFAPNEKNVPTPVLATGYTRSDDGLVWTITLRKGLTFSDGTPLVAKDAVASLKYWLTYSDYAESLGKLVTDMSAPDDTTVVITTSSPFPVIDLISGSDGSRVIKASVAEKADAKGFAKEDVIGSGPYKLKSWSTEEIVLERNDKYQAPEGESSGYAGAKHQYLDTITFKVVADADAVVNGLQTGLWDVAQPTEENYDVLEADANLNVALRNGGNINAMYLNFNAQSPMSNQKARDALNLVLDKKAIMETTGGSPDLTIASGAFAIKGTALYSDAGEAEYNAHDPEKAKALFAEAGVGQGSTLKFVTTGEFPQFKEWAVLAQDQLKKIGIESTIETYDFGTMLDKLKDPSAWDICPIFDVGLPPVPQFSDETSGLTAANFHSDTLDKLMLDYNVAPDADRKAVLDKIQKQVWIDKAAIVLYQSKSFVASAKKVQGYTGWALYFADAWVTG